MASSFDRFQSVDPMQNGEREKKIFIVAGVIFLVLFLLKNIFD